MPEQGCPHLRVPQTFTFNMRPKSRVVVRNVRVWSLSGLTFLMVSELSECIPCFPDNRGRFGATGSDLGNGMSKFVMAKPDIHTIYIEIYKIHTYIHVTSLNATRTHGIQLNKRTADPHLFRYQNFCNANKTIDKNVLSTSLKIHII